MIIYFIHKDTGAKVSLDELKRSFNDTLSKKIIIHKANDDTKEYRYKSKDIPFLDDFVVSIEEEIIKSEN